MTTNNPTQEKSKELLRYIPGRNKVGAILRTTDESIKRYDILEKAINALLKLEKISLIHVIIYMPKTEGGIREKLIKTFGKEKKRIQFESLNSGNFYSDISNYAIGEQIRRGIDYSLLMASEAYQYATEKNLEKMLSAAQNGACMIGLNVREYSEFIEQGFIANTFCLYRNTITSFPDVFGLNSLFQNKKQNEKLFGSDELYIIKKFIEKYGYKSIAIVNPEEGRLANFDDEKSMATREKVTNTQQLRFNKMCELLKIDQKKLKQNLKIIK